MDIKPIRTETDYKAALAEIETLMDAEEGTVEFDTLDILASLVELYEKKHYPGRKPHPVDAIEYYIESRGLTRTEFCQMIGINNNRLAEILNKRRGLSINLIRKIEEQTGIPASVLIQPYELDEYLPQKEAVRAVM